MSLATVAVSAFVLPAREASAAGWAYTASTLVRSSASGATANGVSGVSAHSPLMSADGRQVAFVSLGTNLVPGDLNGHGDVFVKDRRTGAVERISVSTAGVESDGDSYDAAISGDGRYVAFAFSATNLVPGDTNGVHVFVRDRVAGTTTRLSVSDRGAEADGHSDLPSISADISADGNIIVANQGDTTGALQDQAWQVRAWRRDGSLELVCIFVNSSCASGRSRTGTSGSTRPGRSTAGSGASSTTTPGSGSPAGPATK